MQDDLRPRASTTDNFNIKPTDVAPPATTQRLHRCFFGGKARSVALIFRRPAAFTVFLLTLCIDTITKPRTDTRIVYGSLDPIDFSKVVTDGDNHSAIRVLQFAMG